MIRRHLSFQIDPNHIKMLALQSAATVLFVCEERKPDVNLGPNQEDGYDPIGVILYENVSMAPDGLTSALQSMVRLLYDVQTLHIEDSTLFCFIDKGDRELIATALTSYQEWKTAHVIANQIRHGSEDWGITTGFAQRDWTDQNEAFLGLERSVRV